jgi:hypothetical protein
MDCVRVVAFFSLSAFPTCQISLDEGVIDKKNWLAFLSELEEKS